MERDKPDQIVESMLADIRFEGAVWSKQGSSPIALDSHILTATS
jgi:hypothetical protein